MRIFIGVAVLLTACSGTQDSAWDYVHRLGNVLNEVPDDSTVKLLNYPTPRTLVLNEPVNTLSIREFLSLRQCRLHTVLAHRNSSIGKLAPASQRLFSDLDILETGPACLKKLEDSPLKRKLRDYLDQKQSAIGRSLWRAIIGADEHRAFWSNQSVPDDYPKNLNQETTPDLLALGGFVQQVLAGDYLISTTERRSIETHLGQLRFGDGGALLAYFQQLEHAMAEANKLLQARLQRPLCLQTQVSTSARHFQNVVQKFFILDVQKHAVLLNQRDAQLMPAYLALEAQLTPYAPDAYRDWAAQRDRFFERGRNATTRHVTLIQKLYQQCGLVSGNRATIEQ